MKRPLKIFAEFGKDGENPAIREIRKAINFAGAVFFISLEFTGIPQFSTMAWSGEL